MSYALNLSKKNSSKLGRGVEHRASIAPKQLANSLGPDTPCRSALRLLSSSFGAGTLHEGRQIPYLSILLLVCVPLNRTYVFFLISTFKNFINLWEIMHILIIYLNLHFQIKIKLRGNVKKFFWVILRSLSQSSKTWYKTWVHEYENV